MGLFLVHAPSLEALNGGLFISPGYGRHPERVIDSHELIFVRSGVLGIEEEGVDYRLPAGRTLVLEAGRRHRGTLDYSTELSFYWCHFRLTEAGAASSTELPKSVSLSRPERMTELFRLFFADQDSPRRPNPALGRLVELMLLETLEGVAPDARPLGEKEESLAVAALRLMKAKFRDPRFGSSALAKELGCNPDYLNRVFRRVKRSSITDFLQRLRVDFVAQLLLEGRGNVEEAAMDGGFSDRTYMRRVFKKLKGMTPKEYRELHLKLHINVR